MMARKDDDDDDEAAAAAASKILYYDAVSFIDTRRRNERPHTAAELEWWISSYCQQHEGSSSVTDYQMAAWLMAVCCHGLTPEETAILTACTVNSGVRLQWDNYEDDDEIHKDDDERECRNLSRQRRRRLPLVDKHSTGGVGDKISLILAPAVASLGVAQVPMMAGRGLGHTGGTIDKLESIPGFRCRLTVSEFQSLCRTVNAVIAAAGPDLCPADQKLYALRDVTATVRSLPLQTASIMSKKIAENPDSLVLDVKYGLGSFQPTLADAEALAQSLVHTGEANGLQPTTAFLTRMDEPIGAAVGNWLEVRECLDVLKGNFPTPLNRDLVLLTVVQAAQMLYQATADTSNNNGTTAATAQSTSFESCAHQIITALKDGTAWQQFRSMCAAQGGDVGVLDDPDSYPVTARFTRSVCATHDGYLAAVNAHLVGQIAVLLGAGRQVADDDVDATAGILFRAKVGMKVQRGDEIAQLFTNKEESVLVTAVARFHECLEYSDEPVTVPPIITHVVTSAHGVQEFVIPDLGL